MANPVQFINETRAEVAKVVWPTRREVVMTTIMVFIMATLTAIFFFSPKQLPPEAPTARLNGAVCGGR